ncbi:MAG: alpha/beta hydrolase [Candidatus Solibacter usitatus]|nr:alpha/beta hydrolase [Candidatus Solibacter usitatus]
MRRFLALLAVLSAPVCAQTELKPGRKYTTVERLAPERLAAVRAAREALAKERKQLPPVGVYNDYAAVLHIHAEDAPHTLGKRAEVLAAAQAAGIKVVMFSDHNGPQPDTWQGLRDGVLFFAGAENGGKHELVYPAPAPGVRFHSHVEGQMDASADGWDGMEIYNRHSDAEDDLDLLAYLKDAAKSPQKLQELADLMKQYPGEIFGAGCDYWPQIFARWDAILAARPFAGIAANDAHQNTVLGPLTLDPYVVSFRNTSTHVLAREFNEKAIQDSLRAGRAYVSHDWLCDPAGFAFIAVNNLGVYQMGDTIPMTGGTRLVARAPVAARWRIFHNGKVVYTQTAEQVTFQAAEPGAYRAEAWLELDGEQRPWIYSNAIRLEKPSLGALTLPAQALDAGIEAEKDIEYAQGAPEDAAKHKLDIYRPAGAKNAPVLFFVHGGAWRQGDRGQYPFFGNRFAKAGYVVVTVSYRLSPKYPHPAHIEDVAAAFAWTVKNVARHGGDPARIMIAGHSAGGHLVTLLAANPEWLAAHGLSSRNIRGVMALSGVYDISGPLMEGSTVFPADADVRRRASPVRFVKAGLPPFLVTYCQWDYAALPQQALMLHEALRTAGTPVALVYVPGENHISEMTNIPKPADPTAAAMLRFMEGLR